MSVRMLLVALLSGESYSNPVQTCTWQGRKPPIQLVLVADIFQYANAFKTPTTDVNLQSGSTCYIWNPYPYSTPGNGGTLGNRTHRIPDFPITNPGVSVAGECWKWAPLLR